MMRLSQMKCHSRTSGNPGAATMNREETLALYAQGKDAWNAWANAMLAEKKRLEESGEWKSKEDQWQEDAIADFSRQQFDDADFSGFVFPDSCLFYRASFSHEAAFAFTVFYGFATFAHVLFYDAASFDNAIFFDFSEFGDTTFYKEACFWDVSFVDVHFGGAKFLESVCFSWCQFVDKSDEDRDAVGRAIFNNAVFEFDVTFDNAVFHAASFYAINSKAGFDLSDATFKEVPDFIQAHFLEAPRLDNVSIPEPAGGHYPACPGNPPWIARIKRAMTQGEDAPPTPSCQRRLASSDEESPSPRPSPLKGEGEEAHNNNLTARYRALKRMAIQAHDHKREQDFFAAELKSMRGTEHFPFGKNWGWYWAGRFYEVLSDFGRSPRRVLGWMSVSSVLYADAYLLMAQNPFHCGFGTSRPVWAAVQLSLGKTFFPFGNVLEGSSHFAACLFGTEQEFGSGRPVPIIPDWFPLVSLTQSLFSLLLIFLLLLAVRAHFRVK